MKISSLSTSGSLEKYYYWLKRYWVDALVWCYIFFIVYTTAAPFYFNLDPHFLARRWHQVEWIPFFHHRHLASRADMVANVIFFLPLGILLALRTILKSYRRFTARDWLSILAIGALTSLSVEILQIFTWDRDPSATDVVTNSLGALLGAVIMETIYRRFRRPIKRFLFNAFAGKPEMIFSGLLLALIFIGQSAPFTFQISLHSIAAQIGTLIRQPWHLDYPISDLLSNLLLYGSFSYFLLLGVWRYFPRPRTGEWLRLILLLLIIPPLLEIYQLLLPDRNHSLSDVFLAWVSILSGALLWKWQVRRVKTPAEPVPFLYFHRGYFAALTVIYLLFMVNRFFLPMDAITNMAGLQKAFLSSSHYLYYLIEKKRLEALLSVVKEVFAFLPAGFILSFWWYAGTGRDIRGWQATVWSLLIPPVLFVLSVLVSHHRVFWPVVPSAIIGMGTGYFIWQVYLFMMAKLN